MKCPHCRVEIHPDFQMEWLRSGHPLGKEGLATTKWAISSMQCPSCMKAILHLGKHLSNERDAKVSLIYPKGHTRQAASPEVPVELREDFDEAIAVLTDSPKASAALSRRCLQGLLRLQGYTQHDLVKAIDALLASKILPRALAYNVDAIRNIGNFAAHPLKDTNTGQILPVEPHEAEWNLEVLEGLFDYYYVQPKKG